MNNTNNQEKFIEILSTIVILSKEEEIKSYRKELSETIESLAKGGQINSLIEIPGRDDKITPLDLVIFFDSQGNTRLNNPLLRELEERIRNLGETETERIPTRLTDVTLVPFHQVRRLEI
ncbi:hypothetical protein [Wolbachia endosymbiont of Chironomus riparius]|uniref:hypothetical protein n=1 Tax=Wolbachia endosymbiont of Chironomus riparius TaxID=2883238 RepID=UPI0020A1A669|nr:hypothetical protein [Wolbachia endosymbiont of Chironomus riparius]